MPAGVSAYTALANVTLGSSAASVTFSSISQAYRDLVLVSTGTATSNSWQVSMRFNSDSGSNYTDVYMLGTGSSALSASGTFSAIDISFFRSSVTSGATNIFDYSATNKHKTLLTRYDNASDATVARASRWANTAAITSFVLFNGSGGSEQFAAGTTFALYGVSA